MHPHARLFTTPMGTQEETKPRLLAVDDEDAIVRLWAKALSSRFEVMTAPDGAEASKILTQYEDIVGIISDQNMPGMSGIDLLAQAMSTHPFAARILVTASESSADLREAVNRAQVHRFFTKPVRMIDLRSGVEGALAQLGLERENRRLLLELEAKNRALQEALIQIRSAERRLESEVEERTALQESNMELERLALRDPLTGVFNRRFFEESLSTEIARAQRYKLELSLLFVDVDHFKNFNDTLGHPAGDAALIEFARLLGSTSGRGQRESDVVARYGGEEFVVILPQTGPDGAPIVAERLRARIEDHPFEGQEKQPGGVFTASIGWASYPQDASDAAELVDIADRGTFLAKREGRNCVRRGHKGSLSSRG
jgi:diguanylate cyclase (GGDEF)-like protein